MKKIFVLILLSIAPAVYAVEGLKPAAILEGNKAQVRGISFTKNSKQVITAGLDTFIRLWPLKGGKPMLVIGHGAMIESMAYSPDGKYIVTSGRDSSMKLWSAKDGRLIRMPVEKSGNIFSLVFSPDSDFIAAGGANAVNIWKTGDFKKPYRLETGNIWARASVFSPDGRFFLVAGGSKIAVWNVDYGDIISTFTGRGGISFSNRREFDFGCMVFDADFSVDSQYFSACGDDGTIKTWRAEDGLTAWKQPAHAGIALSLAYSKNFLATAGKDGMINFFEIKNGKPAYSIAGCSGVINELVFSADGKNIAAACSDNSVTIWRVGRGALPVANYVKAAVYSAGLIGLAGLAAIIAFVFRKKKSVKDWEV